MSVDLWLTSDEGEDFEVNFTYNYWSMWNLATKRLRTDRDQRECDRRQIGWGELDRSVQTAFLDGLSGRQSIPLLERAIARVRDDPEAFVALNPSNGWGDSVNFLQKLKECLSAALRNPDSVWEAWR